MTTGTKVKAFFFLLKKTLKLQLVGCTGPLFYRDVNIMDNIMALIERHAENLEALVEERTRLLMEEKKKTDKLLYKMLPV